MSSLEEKKKKHRKETLLIRVFLRGDTTTTKRWRASCATEPGLESSPPGQSDPFDATGHTLLELGGLCFSVIIWCHP